MLCDRIVTMPVLPWGLRSCLIRRHPGMFKLALILSISSAAVHGATIANIDAGSSVFTPAFFNDFGTTISMNLSSTGNFVLSSPLITGGGNQQCSFFPMNLGCGFGTYSISANFPRGAVTTSAARADGSIQGIPGPFFLSCGPGNGGPMCPSTPGTSVSLTAVPVTISAFGSYVVPFSATGQIQATTVSDPTTLILDTPIFGVGNLSFSVIPTGLGGFGFVFAGGATALAWNFTAVPEPSPILLSAISLALGILARRLTKGKY